MSGYEASAAQHTGRHFRDGKRERERERERA
jgi:hypothetical protein